MMAPRLCSCLWPRYRGLLLAIFPLLHKYLLLSRHMGGAVKDTQIPRSFMVAICTVIEPCAGFGAVMNVLFVVCVLKDASHPP